MPNDNLAPDAVRMRMQLAVVGPWSLNAYALICPHKDHGRFFGDATWDIGT